MCVEWSPDDTMILTSGSDHFALLFDPMTGKKLQVLTSMLMLWDHALGSQVPETLLPLLPTRR